MTATIELNSARRKLQNALGDNHKSYFSHLRSWFRKRCTKEEFDVEAKKLLSADQFHTHNEFLLAILNKCQTLANFTLMTSPTVKNASVTLPTVMSPTASLGSPNSGFSLNARFQDHSDNGRLRMGVMKKNKSGKINHRPNFEQRFQPASPPPEILFNCDEFEPYDPDERNLMFAFKEPTLPDNTMVSARLLIAAWDEGLDGSINDPTASELITAAVDQLLKNIIVSMLTDKSSYKLSKNKTPYAVGSVIANPYLITKQRSVENESKSNAVTDEILEQKRRKMMPNDPNVEQSSIWELACAHKEASKEDHCKEVTLYDLLATLKKHRTLIPSHNVYSVNMERLLCKLHHDGHED